jgi:hypothetical protein
LVDNCLHRNKRTGPLAAVASEVSAGQQISRSTWWVNEGVAPVFRSYVLALRLGSPGHSAVVRTDADVRKGLPGDAVSKDPVCVPDDLPAGDCQLSVALLDPVTLPPAIRLGIEGRDSDGWYRLGKIHVKAEQ